MAVIQSKRKPSSVQFLDTAYELNVLTIQNCLKIEKRYTFLISTELVKLANSVHNNVKAANSVFPSNKHEAQIRRDYLIRANSSLQALFSQIDILYGLHPEKITDKMFEAWLDMAETEAKLISGAKSSDKKRYENLPE